jgi:hypothetical protein
MKREIKIFKSFEEQEEYHLNEMRNPTVKERFINLYRMQMLTKAFNSITDKSRKIIIKHGHSAR